MKSRSALVLVPLAASLIAGCAQNGTLTTGSLNPKVVDEKQVAANKQACATLAAQIEGLNKDGISAKIEKAAAKKYKMKSADLAKANELNKANAEFQAKCSSYPMATIAEAPKPDAAKNAEDGKAEKKTAKLTKPPVPPRKALTAEEAAAAKQQAMARPTVTPQAPAEAETASAPKAPAVETTNVASAEAKAEKSSTMESSPTVSQPGFASPRLSAAPATVTTTGNP